MNGKASKRIRVAAMRLRAATGFKGPQRKLVARLKREYKALPYHRRGAAEGLPLGVVPLGHSVTLRAFHALMKHGVAPLGRSSAPRAFRALTERK